MRGRESNAGQRRIIAILQRAMAAILQDADEQ